MNNCVHPSDLLVYVTDTVLICTLCTKELRYSDLENVYVVDNTEEYREYQDRYEEERLENEWESQLDRLWE